MGDQLGNLEEGSSTGYFETWMKGTVGMETSLSLKRERRGLGACFTGEPGRCVKEASGYGHHFP